MFTMCSMSLRPIDRALQWAAEKGWNQSEFARHLGVSAANVTNWKVRGLPPEQLEAVALALGRGVDELLGREPYPALSEAAMTALTEMTTPQRQAQLLSLGADEMWLPKHEGVYAMMGHGGDTSGTEIVSLVRVSKEGLRTKLGQRPHTGMQNLRLITAYGSSMSPTFDSGDVLVVDSGVQTVPDDGIYVFSKNGDLFVKRLQRAMDGSLMVISDNPQHARDRIARDDRASYQVHGRVLLAWNGRLL